jgi:hypothetical protein
MKHSLQAFTIAALSACSAIGGALAQSSDPEIDLAAIRARAADCRAGGKCSNSKGLKGVFHSAQQFRLRQTT